MLLFLRMMLVLYGFIALGTGALGITARYDSSLVPFADNSSVCCRHLGINRPGLFLHCLETRRGCSFSFFDDCSPHWWYGEVSGMRELHP